PSVAIRARLFFTTSKLMFLLRSSRRRLNVLPESRPMMFTSSASLTPCSRFLTSPAIRLLISLLMALNRNSHGRAHRATHGHALDIRSLDRLRLQVQHKVDERLNILFELRRFEAHLANNRVNNPGFVVAELDLAGLVFLHDLGHVGCDRAGTR